jgi:hypothetical protein
MYDTQGRMTVVRRYQAELREQARVEHAAREARVAQATIGAEHGAAGKASPARGRFLARVGALAHPASKATKPFAS